MYFCVSFQLNTPPLAPFAEDMERAREVYRACLKLLPHKAFTFGKVGWAERVGSRPALASRPACTGLGAQKCWSRACLQAPLPLSIQLQRTSPSPGSLPLHNTCSALQIWIMAAQFEIRQLRLDAARKILGMALGMCPKVRRPHRAARLAVHAAAPPAQNARVLVGCGG